LRTEKNKKKQNKNKKTSVKHIRYRLIGVCVNERETKYSDVLIAPFVT